VTNAKCRIDKFISPDDGHSHPKHVEERNKHTKKKLCNLSWLYLQDYTNMHGQQNLKNSASQEGLRSIELLSLGKLGQE
jgi:hypothetical protein